MAKVALFLCFIILCFVFEVVISSKPSSQSNANSNVNANANTPLPSKDCSTLMYNMIDCLSFVENQSKISKPEGSCCFGFKTVLKTDSSCICEGFKGSSKFGVQLNVTKAMTLPSACGIKISPSITNCDLSGAPSPAPAQSPSVAPAEGPDTENVAPAPSNSGGSSSVTSISVVALLLASLVAVA